MRNNLIDKELLEKLGIKVKLEGVGYVESQSIPAKTEIKKVTALNNAVARYFDDREFKTFLTNFLIGLKVSKSETNVMRFIAEAIIKQHEKYMEGFTRNLYISRWI